MTPTLNFAKRFSILFVALILLVGACFRETELLGSEAERVKFDGVAGLENGAMLTITETRQEIIFVEPSVAKEDGNSDASPNNEVIELSHFYFYHEPGEKFLRVFQYDDGEEVFQGPVVLKIFRNDLIGENHVIGVLPALDCEDEDIFFYFGMDMAALRSGQTGEFDFYGIDTDGLGQEILNSATSWEEIKRLFLHARNAPLAEDFTSLTFDIQHVGADERANIIRNALLPDGMEPLPKAKGL